MKTIFIEGMHCQHCVQAVNEVLSDIPGVTSVKVSLEENNAIVDGTNLQDTVLKDAIEEIGFDVISIKE